SAPGMDPGGDVGAGSGPGDGEAGVQRLHTAAADSVRPEAPALGVVLVGAARVLLAEQDRVGKAVAERARETSVAVQADEVTILVHQAEDLGIGRVTARPPGLALIGVVLQA